MRQCLSCTKAIPDGRRVNALYCGRPACRAREYRRRKREAEKTSQSSREPLGIQRAQPGALVITCSCGNRLLVQVSHLGQAEPLAKAASRDLPVPAQPPELARNAPTESGFISPAADIQRDAETRDSVTANGTRQEPQAQALVSSIPTLPVEVPNIPPLPHHVAEEITEAPTTNAALEATPTPELKSAAEVHPHLDESVLSTTAEDPGITSALPTIDPPIASEQPLFPEQKGPVPEISRPPSVVSPGEPIAPSKQVVGFRTCELYGVIAWKTVPLSAVLIHQEQRGTLEVRLGASFQTTWRPDAGFGLAGSPGRWREFYPGQSPRLFGLDVDLAVMYWDEETNRGMVLSDQILTKLLGWDWRRRL